MLEGNHDVVVYEIGDVGHELVLVLPEEPKLVPGCSIALAGHDEDADESGD